MKNMKKVLAVVLCVLTIMSVMPMVFASAAETKVAAQDELADIGTVIVGWFQLWGGMLVKAFGPTVKDVLLPGLKNLLLGNLSFGDFMSSLREITVDLGGC